MVRSGHRFLSLEMCLVRAMTVMATQAVLGKEHSIKDCRLILLQMPWADASHNTEA